MAKSTNTKRDAQSAGNGTTATGAGTGTAAPKTRKTVDPEDMLTWGAERDTVIIQTLLANPNRITNIALTKMLAEHPAFADDVALLQAPGAHEKIRAHVKKLSDAAVEMGLPPLELKRRSNAGYDPRDVIRQAYAQAQARAGALGAGAGAGAGATVQPAQGGGFQNVQGLVAASPGLVGGGLIPTVA